MQSTLDQSSNQAMPNASPSVRQRRGTGINMPERQCVAPPKSIRAVAERPTHSYPLAHSRNLNNLRYRHFLTEPGRARSRSYSLLVELDHSWGGEEERRGQRWKAALQAAPPRGETGWPSACRSTTLHQPACRQPLSPAHQAIPPPFSVTPVPCTESSIILRLIICPSPHLLRGGQVHTMADGDGKWV